MAVASAGCSEDSAHPQVLGSGGGNPAADAGTDLDAGPDDAMPDRYAPFADAAPLSWDPLGDLPFSQYNGFVRFAGIHEGWLFLLVESPLSLYRKHLNNGTFETVELTGASNGLFDEGAGCQAGARVYLLGGGGNGIYSTWLDFHWEGFDVVGRAWLEGGSHDLPYHAPGAAAGQGRCFLLGGNSGGGMSPVPTVQELVLATGQWKYHPDMSKPLIYAAGVVSGDYVYAAGGGRNFEPGDQTSTNWGVAVDDFSRLSLGEAAPWEKLPGLPWPLLRATLLDLGDRLLLAGGVTNDDYHTRPELLSWKPGDSQWTIEGTLPALEFGEPAFATDGHDLYAILREPTGTQYATRLYRWAR